MKLTDLQPKEVFYFFEKISAIPRGSRNSDGIANFLVNFAAERELPFVRDDFNNVIIIKPSAPELESKAPVILQGHTDMVCEKEQGSKINFLSDGLELRSDGNFVWAEGTTLGADDGVAIAFMLALLDADRALPRLECVFTSDEEIGMLGAAQISLSPLKGTNLINLDSDKEGVLTVACAGGASCDICFPVTRESFEGHKYLITVSGLLGGHSGEEINKGRLNADMLLANILGKINAPFALSRLSGGNKENAIPALAQAEIIFKEKTDITPLIEGVAADARCTEKSVRIVCEYLGKADSCAVLPCKSKTLVSVLNAFPNGVFAYEEYDKSLVKTSLNLGIAELGEQALELTFCLRSSRASEVKELVSRLKKITEKHGGKITVRGEYSPWEYKENSYLRTVMVNTFTELYGNPPETVSIHAGLECGVLSAKKPGIDCVSCGPDIFDIHTYKERLSVASTLRVWEYINKVIDNL